MAGLHIVKYDNSGEAEDQKVAGKRLQSFIERAERLATEITELQEDQKEVFAEAKGVGFDVPTIKEIIKLRKMDADRRREKEELLTLYKSSIGMD